ncbi:MAG: type II toxin-antitoxin system VapC family toxin [Carboxydocellales bacterium]
MTNRYILDTNIVIYALRPVEGAVEYIEKISLSDGEFFFSTITEAEVFSKPLDEELAEAFDAFFSSGTIVPVSSEIARLAGEIRVNTKAKLPDALIAATALSLDAVLVTHDVDYYKKMQNAYDNLLIEDPIGDDDIR